MMEWAKQKPVRRGKNLFGPLGGFAAILGFLLPFHGDRSLFSIMDGTTLPFLPQVILLTLVAVIVLYDLGFIYVPCFFSTQLFIWMCIFYGTLFSRHPFGVVTANMQIGMYLIPAGLLGMLLHPLFSDRAEGE
ncbi:MAG: hypothetical protein J6C43_03170 [Oscillospiraceae bacterium]|nr:hypothetical protein [Oscillospiraceae bacterium]MBP3520434.1 hypothetical protein [Oscillospiraceae bacterium]